MEIVLVNPGKDIRGSGLQAIGKNQSYMYPYSIIYLYNYLLKKGIKSRVFDLYIKDTQKLLDYCRELKRPIIGVTAQTHSSITAIGLIRRIKAVSPDSIIVVGGKHFGYCAQDTLKSVKEVDIVVRGEGELTFYELVKALRCNGDLSLIDGITYRKSNSIAINRERKAVDNLEKFALDYKNLPYNDYFSKGIFMRNFEMQNIKSLPMYLGRGCSQKCVFCSYNKFTYRTRKLDAVLNEIGYLKEKYKTGYFTFSDPSFCERRVFAREFCNRLLKEKFDIKWSCEARADTPFELLELMAKAGCISLDFALESASEKVLRAIRKKVDLQKVVDFAKYCRRLGIRSHVFAMVSLPEECEEDAYKTMGVLESLSAYCSSMSVAVSQIYPGTELEDIARKKRILPEGFSYHDSRFFHNYKDICDINVPLYIEKLTVGFIRRYLKRVNDMRAARYDTVYHLMKRAVSGIKTIHKRSFSKNLDYVLRFIYAAVWHLSRKR